MFPSGISCVKPFPYREDLAWEQPFENRFFMTSRSAPRQLRADHFPYRCPKNFGVLSCPRFLNSFRNDLSNDHFQRSAEAIRAMVKLSRAPARCSNSFGSGAALIVPTPGETPTFGKYFRTVFEPRPVYLNAALSNKYKLIEVAINGLIDRVRMHFFTYICI